MQVSKDRIERYRSELSSAANDAAEFMSDYYDALRASHPDSSVAELRNMAIKSIKQALNAFSPQAGELAGELFDEIVKAEELNAKFRYQPTIEPDLVDKKVHYLAKDLVDGNSQKFIDACSALTRFYVHREANMNMYQNVARNKLCWARIPSGTETCGWCFMLSTRGFAYTSETKAGGLGHKFHLHCDCIIVPGTKETTVEGYNPKEMYTRWVECANTIGLKPTWKNRSAIIAECERRDFKWLYTGVGTGVGRGKDFGVDISGLTNRQWKKKKENHEQDGYIALNVDHGFQLKVLPEKQDQKNLDMIIAGDYWELKTINGGGGAIPNRIDDGVLKWQDKRLIEATPNLGTPKLVIDNRFSTCTDEHAINVIKYKMNQYRELGYDNTILITSDNKCVYIIRDGEKLKVL